MSVCERVLAVCICIAASEGDKRSFIPVQIYSSKTQSTNHHMYLPSNSSREIKMVAL